MMLSFANREGRRETPFGLRISGQLGYYLYARFIDTGDETCCVITKQKRDQGKSPVSSMSGEP